MVVDQIITDDYALYNGDCNDVISEMKDESIHLSVYSPPFGGLYHYSSDPRDLSNSNDYSQFFDHYDYTVSQISRITKPGRITAVHCMDVPSGNSGNDYLSDFPGDIIRLHQKHGFGMICRHTIWKEPLAVRNRTMRKDLTHMVTVDDCAYAGVAGGDYMLIFRKKGENKEPIVHPTGFDKYAGACEMPSDILSYKNFKGDQKQNIFSHWIWRRYASCIWDDIDIGDVLPFHSSNDGSDQEEKHVHPLQLSVIERVIQMRSNKGDIVLTPFLGIGSEAYVSVRSGRKAVGVELKTSYYNQAVRNVMEGMSGFKEMETRQREMFS